MTPALTIAGGEKERHKTSPYGVWEGSGMGQSQIQEDATLIAIETDPDQSARVGS